VVREGHAIAATDYIENRFRDFFMGLKEFKDLKLAKGVLTFTTNPVGSSLAVVGARTYTFVATLTLADHVLIGANSSASLDNLIAAILATPDKEGVTYGTGTLVHADAVAKVGEQDTMIVEAKVEGLAGNLLVTTTDIPGATWANPTLTGGTDTGRPQPLSFPRLNLVDRDGNWVVGMPERLKQATAEYSVRSAGGILLPDPGTTTGLRVIEKEELVGPIKERTKWKEGGRSSTVVSYPAADRLLADYLMPSGILHRG
jgi:hypothetical protein